MLERPAWTNYERVLALYVRPHLGRVLLQELQPTALSALYVTLTARGGQHGQPLSTTTVRLVHRVLHKALADAVIEGMLAANPADRVRPPRRRTAETLIWTAPQIRTCLTSVQDDTLFAAGCAPADGVAGREPAGRASDHGFRRRRRAAAAMRGTRHGPAAAVASRAGTGTRE